MTPGCVAGLSPRPLALSLNPFPPQAAAPIGLSPPCALPLPGRPIPVMSLRSVSSPALLPLHSSSCHVQPPPGKDRPGTEQRNRDIPMAPLAQPPMGKEGCVER